jgi:hypothetical protein
MRALYNCLLLSPLTQKYFSQEHNDAFQSSSSSSSSSSSCSIPHIIISLLSFRIGPPERHLAPQCAPFWGIGSNDQLQMAAACLKLLCCCVDVARAMVAAGDFPRKARAQSRDCGVNVYAGVVEKAVPLLKVPNGITRETAAGLLHNACAMVPSACDRVREAGALPLLMALLTEEGCSYGQQVAAAAVRCVLFPQCFFVTFSSLSVFL